MGATQAQWAQVENVYQRRADLVPNLVETVKSAANFEKDERSTAVTEAAQSQVGQVKARPAPRMSPTNPQTCHAAITSKHRMPARPPPSRACSS